MDSDRYETLESSREIVAALSPTVNVVAAASIPVANDDYGDSSSESDSDSSEDDN